MKRHGELVSIICHPIVDLHHLTIGQTKGALHVVWMRHGILRSLGQLSDSIGMIFFELSAFLEEKGKFLGVWVSRAISRSHIKGARHGAAHLTLAVAMLCLSLFSSVATPISELRTDWTGERLSRSPPTDADVGLPTPPAPLVPFSLAGAGVGPMDMLPVRWR